MLVIDAFIPPEYQVHIIDDKYFINVTVIITNISKVSCLLITHAILTILYCVDIRVLINSSNQL